MADAAAGAEGGMAAVLGLERAAVEEVVATVGRPTELVVANDNAPGQVVISGRLAALEAATASMRAAGARRVVRLHVSGAFHSPLMSSVAGDLATAFAAEVWRDAHVPIVSNVTAEPLTAAARIRALLAEQVRSPVEWVRCVERMVADGITSVIECGPGTALTGTVKRIAPGLRTANVGDRAGLDAAVALLGGTPAGVSA
jgi:[acyl-carrier-protein] S-malonyltransferase